MKSNSIDLLGTYGSFVEVGVYPNQQKYIPYFNHRRCGMRYVSNVYVIRFNKNCFENVYSEKTLVEYENGIPEEEEDLFPSQLPSQLQPEPTRYLPPPHPYPGRVMSRIFNGREAKAGEAPWTVYLHIKHDTYETKHHRVVPKTQVYKCTGSLLTFEWVITAAHCLDKR